MRSTRSTVCLDFDGTITEGWARDYSEMVLREGAAEALRTLHKSHKLVICTARGDLDNVRAFLRLHHLEPLFEDVTNRKPTAAMYPDDRGYRFDGDWDALIRAAQELPR